MCAASESPIKLAEEGIYFGDNVEDILKSLERQGLVQNTPNGWVYSGKERATEAVGLDNISSNIFKVICDGKLLETMDKTHAYREAHEGAVLLHQGETYTVEDLDLKNPVVQVKKKDTDYYTEVKRVIDISILEEIEKRKIGNVTFSFGGVKVNEKYVGYKILKYEKVVGRERLNLPPLDFETMGLWFTVPEDIRKKIKDENLDFDGGLHGIEHAMIGIMPFHVMCDRWDIGGLSTPEYPDTTKATIFIYDGFEGGIGLTEKAFELIAEIVKMTLELVRECECEDGCPACIYSPKCGNENKPLDKKGAILILEELLAMMTARKVKLR